MIPIKLYLNLFVIFCLSFLASCGIKDTLSNGNVASSPEIVNRLVGNNISPPDFQSRSQSLIVLSYTSIDKDLASSCTIGSLNKVTVTQACNCDGMGVCTVGVTGEGAYSGAGSFSFNVVAAGKTSTTGKANFTITAPPAGSNVAPTITAITAKTTTEGVAINSIAFTVADSDSTVTCANVVATSTNTTLVPVSIIVISGASRSCNASITPTTNTYGSSNIVFTLTDTGTPLPAKTATASFTLTVTGVNDAPTISAITAQATNEDTVTSAIAFTVADSDSTLTCGSVSGTSSNSTLVSNSNIVIAGTAPNCTVRVTPNLNQFGTASITLVVTDNGLPLPAKTATTTFGLTVNAVNDPPVLSTIATQTTNQNVALAVPFTISDLESTVTCSGSVSIASANTTLVPNTNMVISGTAPNCSVLVTPANNRNGTTNLTVTLTDAGLPMPARTATRTFAFIVNQVNVAPTISAITSKTTNEDTPTSAITFTIADTDSTVLCSNVAGTSSNTTIVPDANIVISGTAPNCSAVITPAANYSGLVTITLTLTDNGTPLPPQTATSIFGLTITAVNDEPTISTITNRSTDEDTASNPIAFTIADTDSSLTCNGSVAVTSSDTTLIPNGNIVISGTAPNCSMIITPTANLNGSSTITLTVTDNGTPLPVQTATTNFTMTVDPVIDLTGTLSVANNLSGVASSYSSNSYGRIISFNGLTSDEAVTTFEVCLGTASGSCDVSSWVVANVNSSGSAPTISLTGNYRMVSGEGGAQNFTLSPSCLSSDNYYYSVRAINSSSNISNVISMPGWNFWEPKCLTGSVALTQWLDASEPDTITTAPDVSNWYDKSSENNDITQTDPDKQPSYVTSELGGRGGVVFDGIDNTLTGNPFIYNQTSATVFTVMKGSTSTQNMYLISEGHSITSAYYAPIMINANTNYLSVRVVADFSNRLTSTINNSTILNGSTKLGMMTDSGSSILTYSNGVQQSQGPFGYTRATSTLDTYVMGARYRNANETSPFSGTVGEFIVTKGILTGANKEKLEGYTAHKWGVRGNLDVSHPYSVSPP